jgi:hypothetical protein
MNKLKSFIKGTALVAGLIFPIHSSFGQGGFDNSSRALYIFDMVAKYVNFGPGFADSANFKIGIMLGDEQLLFELGNLAKTRPIIQGKPVQISGYSRLERLSHTQVLYVNKNAGFDLGKIKEKIAGKQTVLVTEGYEFRESMINFVIVGGVPRYDINEDYLKKEGMSIPQTVLFDAVKTKEDWENLFVLTDADLQVQKETVKQQQVEIERQKAEILRQKAMLDSLDRQITLKEKTLLEKQKMLNAQLVQISRQKSEITSQKQVITVQQQAVQVQQDTLRNQKEKIVLQLSMIDGQLKKISDQESKIKIQLATLEKQKLILYFVIFALLLVSFLGYYIYRGYKIKKEANIKLE